VSLPRSKSSIKVVSTYRESRWWFW